MKDLTIQVRKKCQALKVKIPHTNKIIQNRWQIRSLCISALPRTYILLEFTYLNNKLEEIKSVEKQVIEKASTLIYDDYLQRCLLEILQAKSKQIDSCYKR